MKILHQNAYKYVGISNKMHVFVSIKKNFDPEIIYLERAKFINNDGSTVYYDPIIEYSEDKVKDVDYLYQGVDSDGNPYSVEIEVKKQFPYNSAACVNQPEHLERNLKRRLVKYENLIKDDGFNFHTTVN